ncbi:mechanosensitive ion channel family protein [Pseudovibrio exalbescens]|uniref:Low conductance mechanosensitive channel YnaI n=1 Tax=Pseudovibrio exalbescens TaxID=197461 RepID=A0A1U7JFR3_9HYPH|nr:mechanosensitive ion channel family protein [Pseudovibrio exalbescens]OKL43590.1 hypothetical protein A3843_13255 [Pseudovibrio exalbescens]
MTKGIGIRAWVILASFFILIIHGLPGLPQAQSQPLASAENNADFAPPSAYIRAFDANEMLTEYPLAPADTSSPRASLESFISLMSEANRLVLEAYEANRKLLDLGEESALTDSQIEQRIDLARVLFDRAQEIFDFSGLPTATREETALENIMLMKEILDRIPLPLPETIPGNPAGSYTYDAPDLPDRWTLPQTRITLQKDENSGYLFTPETVANIPNYYEQIKDFPSHQGATQDLFQFYTSSPGDLLPPPWYVWIENADPWLMEVYEGQTVWQWIALIGLAVLLTAAFLGLRHWHVRRPVPLHAARRKLFHLTLPVAALLALQLLQYLAVEEINITSHVVIGLNLVIEAVSWALLAIIVYLIIDFVAATILSQDRYRETLDASILRTGFRILGITAVLCLLGYGATRLGIPLFGVIAGLGVGGLAIALAAQPTLENLIGGIILYADRMVRVGEFCQFGEFVGTVESIGIRSTRVRALDRTLVTVANADLAKMRIVNYTRRDRTYLRRFFGLRYETTPDQLRTILMDIRAYITNHPDVMDDTVRVRFLGYNGTALEIEVAADILKSAYEDFLAVQEDIFFAIYDIIQKNGSGFALPSTTAYFAKDKGLAEERQKAAEHKAEDLRGAHELPYPSYAKTSCTDNSAPSAPETTEEAYKDGKTAAAR